ncbi:MAG: recombinase family protein [Armatimonadetes bacterium]|nr:recombinase family protein [Armatimonadota bacterium]
MGFALPGVNAPPRPPYPTGGRPATAEFARTPCDSPAPHGRGIIGTSLTTKNMDYSEYRRKLSAKGTAAMMRKKAEGEWTHRAPFGWRNARDAEGRAVLEVEPSEMRTVLRAMEMRAEGMSVREIAMRLAEQGRRSRDGRRFSAASVWRIVNQGSA